MSRKTKGLNKEKLKNDSDETIWTPHDIFAGTNVKVKSISPKIIEEDHLVIRLELEDAKDFQLQLANMIRIQENREKDQIALCLLKQKSGYSLRIRS